MTGTNLTYDWSSNVNMCTCVWRCPVVAMTILSPCFQTFSTESCNVILVAPASAVLARRLQVGLISCPENENIVACQGSGVSIKSRHLSTDKGHPLPFSLLNRWTIPNQSIILDMSGKTNTTLLRQGGSGTPQYLFVNCILSPQVIFVEEHNLDELFKWI